MMSILGLNSKAKWLDTSRSADPGADMETFLRDSKKFVSASTGVASLRGDNLFEMSTHRLRDVRGSEIAMIFQDPMTSLNPVHSVGDQLIEAVLLHRNVGKKEARDRAIAGLLEVGIPRAESRIDDYPHQFSGGMRQRVMIAMALINEPDVLIADEPTTALDVTTQAQILELIKQLQQNRGTAVVMITHDLGVVAEVADDVVVMYAARIAESAEVHELFGRPLHPYTWGLLGSLPRVDLEVERLTQIVGQPPSLLNPPKGCRFNPRCEWAFDRCHSELPVEQPASFNPAHLDACFLSEEKKLAELGRDGGGSRDAGEHPMSDALLEVRNVTKHFPITRGIIFQKQVAAVQAVDGVSLTVKQGETLGIVGESGCGKSTLARVIMRLLEPTSGEIIFDGHDISRLSQSQMRPFRREMMMIFQDPYASLNSRKRVGFIVAEALDRPQDGHRGRDQAPRPGASRGRRAQPRALQPVPARVLRGAAPAHRHRPGARGEPEAHRRATSRSRRSTSRCRRRSSTCSRTSSREFGLTYVFIAHDLHVVRHISDRVAVMYLGKLAELADASVLYDSPKHPYTGALLSAVPLANPQLGRQRKPITLEGDVPNPINPPSGCRFHPRCPPRAGRALRRGRADDHRRWTRHTRWRVTSRSSDGR